MFDRTRQKQWSETPLRCGDTLGTPQEHFGWAHDSCRPQVHFQITQSVAGIVWGTSERASASSLWPQWLSNYWSIERIRSAQREMERNRNDSQDVFNAVPEPQYQRNQGSIGVGRRQETEQEASIRTILAKRSHAVSDASARTRIITISPSPGMY